MASKPPVLVKLAALLLVAIALRAAVGGGVMVWRFGAFWDAAFFVGVAACLALLALGVYRGRMHILGVAALATLAAHQLSSALSAHAGGSTDLARWFPMALGGIMAVTALLLAATPSVRRWFAAPEPN